MPLLLLSKSQPLTLGCDLVSGANLKTAASILLQYSSSSYAHSAAPRFQIEPAALGFDLVSGAALNAEASILLRYSMSEQAIQSLLRLFYRCLKEHHPPAPLQRLPELSPLRGVSIHSFAVLRRFFDYTGNLNYLFI